MLYFLISTLILLLGVYECHPKPWPGNNALLPNQTIATLPKDEDNLAFNFKVLEIINPSIDPLRTNLIGDKVNDN
jgi:hypothetical protein